MRISSPKLTRERTPFIGRRREQEQLRAELARGAALVTLTGPSGIGKTRLALQVAGSLSDSFEGEGGVWFCSLADCADASDLEAAVARALQIQQQQGDELARSIANRGPLLLILDNADPIAARSAEVLERWLEHCVELQMIMTSLIPAGVPAEVPLELRPLEPDDAVALYVDRARRAWADRSFAGDEADEVEDLVKRLDRLPLAIELAAARVRILPPRTMLSMFDKRFDFLRSSAPRREDPAQLPQRRGSLLSALELTWSHLEPHEQLALARAAIFDGGFTVEAANAVLMGSAATIDTSSSPLRAEISQTLDNLHRKSLLRAEDMESPRFFLLESVKEYAQAELLRMGGWDEAIRRHAAFYLDQEQAQPEVGMFLRQHDSVLWLRQERANLVAIHHRFLQAAPSLSARAGISLAPLFLWEGASSSEAKLSETALEAARSSQDPKLILLALEAVQIAQLRNGRFDQAKAAIEEFAQLARAGGEKAAEASALALLARLHLDRGEVDLSLEPLHRAAALSKEVGRPHVESDVHLALGMEARTRGALEEAGTHFVRSADIAREHGLDINAVNALHQMGINLANLRGPAEARGVLQETIEVSRRLRHRAYEAQFLFNLANIELAAGRLDHAEAAARKSLQIQRELGHRFREGLVLCSLGIISLERGAFDAASEWLFRAEEVVQSSDGIRAHPEVLLFLAVLEARRGQLLEARRLLDEVRDHPLAGGKKLGPGFLEGAEAFLRVVAARHCDPSNRGEAEASVANARALLRSQEREPLLVPSYLPMLHRLLEQELATWTPGTPPPSLTTARLILSIGSGRDWFQLPGNQRVDLHNRRLLHLLFSALVQARLDTPGVAVRYRDLVQAGWPGMEIGEKSAAKRLKTAIWVLRDLGLRAVVMTDPSGYFLDPAFSVEEREEA